MVVGLLRMEGEELEACDHAGEGASAGAGYDDHVEEGVEVIFLGDEFEGEAGEAETAAGVNGFSDAFVEMRWWHQIGLWGRFRETRSSWSLRSLRSIEEEVEWNMDHEEIEKYHIQRMGACARRDPIRHLSLVTKILHHLLRRRIIWRMSRRKKMRDLDGTKRLVLVLRGNASVLRDEMGL